MVCRVGKRRLVTLSQGGGDLLPSYLFGLGTGLYTVGVSSGGSGHTVGDIITLAGGTASYAATIRVAAVSAGVITSATIVRPGIYSSAPSSPASQGSTTGSGTGATFIVAFNPTVASSIDSPTRYIYNNAALRWNVVTPITNIGSSGWGGSAAYIGTYNSVEFVYNGRQLDLLILGYTSSCGVMIDGKLLTDSNLTTAGAGYYVLTLLWQRARSRVIRLFGINLAVRCVAVPSASAVTLPAYTRPPLAYILGDSYTLGTGAAQGSTWAMEMCRCNGWEPLPVGIGGTGWNSATANVPATRVSDDLLKRAQVPAYVISALGFNDAGGNMTTAAAAYNAAIDAIQAALPAVPIVTLGPWTPVGETAALATVKSMLSTNAAGQGIDFVDISDIITADNKASYTGGDNVHPTAPGHLYLGQQIAPRVAAALAA